ncbi:MAG: type I restriction endonuclease subunit R [Culicoidibacterales bacterium]
MSTLKPIISTSLSTVVAEYEPTQRFNDSYQSEDALEREFIARLVDQGYEHVSITHSSDLEVNLRKQLERLNGYLFTDSEWEYFFKHNIASKNEGIVEKTKKIQEDYVQTLKCEDGKSRNIYLIDKKQIHNNSLQVINQYEEKSGNYENRYDVTILVNGLPLVHVELKRRGVAIKEAFNQINRYQRESFWASSGLYEYVQLFVISNGTSTKYYSNTTRSSRIDEAQNRNGKNKKTSHSFEFTSFWADGKNRIIDDLIDFTKTFFARHTILNILTKYCVFTSQNLLLVMRPYQIVATEAILNRIEIATNYKMYGSIEAGGYVWHTTGSGKTLTSFKTAQLASKSSSVDKVLFVVDRKDLDYQTMLEYEKFEKGAANGNSSTKVLKEHLEDPSKRILVTTIQKLDKFISKHTKHPVFTQNVVLIFDECHRSQFGQMHTNITKHFKKYYLFGFTGTPIFAKNAPSGNAMLLKTTEQAFGRQLHSYTIVDAIRDTNVLPFRVDYVKTIERKSNIADTKVPAINREEVFHSHAYVEHVTRYILEHFDQKTLRNTSYQLAGKRMNGFNSMFAVSSIEMCKKYYLEFKKQIAQSNKDLTIATIFSFAANEEDASSGILDEESFDTSRLDQSSREFLDSAIADYNQTFKTNYDTSSKGFEDYYKDLSDKVKERKVDLVIVVNMFLTGFDATTLNTLWVDKNLKMHGLIQAFSRTNRILNSVKSYGNIVCFRNLEDQIHEAIALFGDKEASGIILLRTFAEYYAGYVDDKGKQQLGYEALIAEMESRFPLNEVIVGEANEKAFIKLFGKILRLRNILTSFDEFKENEILSPRDLQDYTGKYYDLYEVYKTSTAEKVSILDDIVFEMELVKQTEVNIDYILHLVMQYHNQNIEDKEIRGAIDTAVQSSSLLRSKKELIEQFIQAMNRHSDIEKEWPDFVKRQWEIEMEQIISEYQLNEHAKTFIQNTFRDGILKTTGTDIDNILPPMSRFDKTRSTKKEAVINRLQKFFNKYFGIRQDIY